MINHLPRIKDAVTWRYWVAAGAGALAIGGIIGFFGLWGVGAIVAFGLVVVIMIKPELLFWAVIGSTVLGQLVRIPIAGGSQALLPNDILLPILIMVWLLRRLGSRSIILPRMSLWLPMAAVALCMAISLFANRSAYVAEDLFSGALYYVRWLEYAALLFITLHLATRRTTAWAILLGLVWAGVGISILGFIQLQLFPDFSFMAPKGWDPHIGRLLSTWFDPNFLAGYLAATIGITLSVAIDRGRRGFWWWAATMIMSLAVVLTYSRSGYVAFAIAFAFVTALRARWVLYVGALALVAVFLFVPRVQERVLGIRSIDETAQLRIVSWKNAFTIIADHPVTGVGYNLYREAQDLAGFLEDDKAHSATGSDSSLLLITATTGLGGLIAYLWLIGAMFWEMIRTAMNKSVSRDWRAVGLGAAAAIAALFIHSQFVNGLLYPHIMQWMWIVVGIGVAVRAEEAS